MATPKTTASSSENGAGRSRHQPFGPLLLHLSALLLFLLFFVGTALVVFPKARLRDYVVSRFQRQTGQRLAIGQLSFSPLLRVVAKDISWQPLNGDWPPVVVDRLSLSPAWISLFGSNPAGFFQAAIAGGTVDGHLARDGSGSVRLADVNIAPFIPAKFPFPPSGKIGGTVTAQKPAASGIDTVMLDLVAKDLKVAGLGSFGLAQKELTLGRLQLRGRMVGRDFKIEDLRNEGGDLSLAGHGSILIGTVPARCRLNLRVELRPNAALAASLHSLLQLVGLRRAPDGAYKFRLLGTLTRPVLR